MCIMYFGPKPEKKLPTQGKKGKKYESNSKTETFIKSFSLY